MEKKKFSINDISVKKKITVITVGMILIMLVISGISMWAISTLDESHNNLYKNYGTGKFYLSEAYSNFADSKVRIIKMLYMTQDSSEISSLTKELEEHGASTNDFLSKFESKIGSYNSDIVSKYRELVSEINEYMDFANDAAKDAQNGNVDQARIELQESGVKVANSAEAKLLELIQDMDDASAKISKNVERESSVLQGIMIGIDIVAIFIILIYRGLLVKAITVPVKRLSEAAKKLAVGDIEVNCEKVYNDDLGELMDEFALMAEGIKEQVKIAEEISKGDFAIDVQPRSEQDVLGKALRKLVLDESRTLNNIKEAGAQITVGSEQVANASQALAQGSTEQASAIEQVTASMDEVTQRTKDNATEAGEANKKVNNIKIMAESGNEQMKDMIKAMDSINESSETISKIIKTIDDIAFQTNILALNAAVEAARAGVHGKGFAVVAEEVRNLAAKSASAASETAEMIEDSIRKIENGTKLAEETAKSLDEIVKSIEEIVTSISSITISSNDQATAISQIDQAITQVSTVVQTNAATSEQCAAASEELSNQAVTLKNLIGQYKLMTSGQGGFADSSSSYNSNEDIISLDGDFSKY